MGGRIPGRGYKLQFAMKVLYADGYLQVPFTAEEFLHAVKQILQV